MHAWHLRPHTHHTHMQAAQAKGKGAGLSRIKREQRMVPQLIHAIEQWESRLVVASKAFKAKGLGLLQVCGIRGHAGRAHACTCFCGQRTPVPVCTCVALQLLEWVLPAPSFINGP